MPRGAARRTGDAAHVWLVRDGKASQAPVTLGRDFGEQIQVLSGLRGSETVIVGDVSTLAEGQAVATGQAPR